MSEFFVFINFHRCLFDLCFLVAEYVICRHCGNDITISNFFLNKLSPLALWSTNYTFYDNKNILIQRLENPFGIQSRVAIVHRANCAKLNSPVIIR